MTASNAQPGGRRGGPLDRIEAFNPLNHGDALNRLALWAIDAAGSAADDAGILKKY